MTPAAWLVLSWLAAVWSTAVWALRPGRDAVAMRGSTKGRILLLRPCAGAEPELSRTLASSVGARTQRELAVRFAVASRLDAAFPIAEAAADALTLAGEDAKVIITGAEAPNAKADQLARVISREPAPFDLVVVCDSDVDLAGTDLDALIAPLLYAGVGASWAAPIEASPVTLADRASAGVLSASLHAFPLLAMLDPATLVGKLFAIRAETLAEVGGFDALSSVLGEDAELSRRLRARGLTVVLAPVLARSRACGRTFAQVVARYARWINVVRAQRRPLLVSYPLLFAFTGPVLASALLLMIASPSSNVVVVLSLLAVRAFVAVAARVRAGGVVGPWLAFDAIAADVVLTCAFLSALRAPRVLWRGRRLTVARGGVLTLDQAGS